MASISPFTAGGLRPRAGLALFPVFAASVVTACSTAPTSPVRERVTALSEDFSGDVVAGDYQSLEWWKSFDDPVLDRVVEAVLDSNFDLAEAVARVEQARARARIANAATRLPAVQPSVGANDFETPTNAGIGAQLDELGLDAESFGDFGFELPDRLGLTTYSVGADFAYELDFWGRDRNSARRMLGDAQAALPLTEGRLADAQARLWVLLGGCRADLASMLPDSLSPGAALEAVPAGIPADLLVQRPDVSAARQRMEAARYALGARRAERLPSLSLAGSIGLQSSDSNDWFDPDQWFDNLTVNLLGPAFQGARLQSNVALAEARLDEAAAAYGRSVVTAVNEVEAALAGWETGRRRHGALASIADAAQSEAALQERRYVSGVGDYATYLAASQTLVSANSALAAAVRALGFARLALHRALGGAWTDREPTAFRRRDTVRATEPTRALASAE